jgi:hypothetical protein
MICLDVIYNDTSALTASSEAVSLTTMVFFVTGITMYDCALSAKSVSMCVKSHAYVNLFLPESSFFHLIPIPGLRFDFHPIPPSSPLIPFTLLFACSLSLRFSFPSLSSLSLLSLSFHFSFTLIKCSSRSEIMS